MGPRAKNLGVLSAGQKVIVLIDNFAEGMHEGGNLLADRRPCLVNYDQPDINVRISVAGSAADRPLDLQGTHSRILLRLAKHATEYLDVSVQLRRQLVEPGGGVFSAGLHCGR